MSSPTIALAAQYDGDGMRAQKTASGTTTDYLYDGDQLLEEITYSGTTPTLQSVYLSGADGLRARWSANTGSPFTYAYSFDPEGSLAQLQLTQNWYYNGRYAENTFCYDGFGQLLGDVKYGGGAAQAPFDSVGFGGQFGYHQDPETGLYQLGARYYDAGKGRFVNRDPIGYQGGANLYGFCGNNPVNQSDPSGLTIEPYGYNMSDSQIQAKAAATQKDIDAVRQYLAKGNSTDKNAISVSTLFQELDKAEAGTYIVQEVDGSRIGDPEKIDTFAPYKDGPKGGLITWDPHSGTLLMNSENPGDFSGKTQTPALALLHELGHAYLYAISPNVSPESDYNKLLQRKDDTYTNYNEKYVIDKIETPTAKLLREGVRENHFGAAVPVPSITHLPENPRDYQ